MILVDKEDGTEYEADEYTSHVEPTTFADLYVLKPIKKPRWRADKGEYYFFVDMDMTVDKTTDVPFETDTEQYITGNYFDTHEKALAAAKALKAVLAYIHTADEYQAMKEAIDEAQGVVGGNE